MSAALTAFAVRYNVVIADAYVLPALFERTAQKLGQVDQAGRTGCPGSLDYADRTRDRIRNRLSRQARSDRRPDQHHR